VRDITERLDAEETRMDTGLFALPTVKACRSMAALRGRRGDYPGQRHAMSWSRTLGPDRTAIDVWCIGALPETALKRKDPSGGTTGRVKLYGRLGWMGARAEYSRWGGDNRSHIY
jgi:hypothetical protein